MVRDRGRPAGAPSRSRGRLATRRRCARLRPAREELGGLDLLVNNAGVEKPFLLVDMPLEEWQQVIDVNLTGTFLCSREAARGIMRADEARAARS